MLTGKDGQSTFQKTVETQLGQAMQDEREKEEKKNNIMLFNIPESEKLEAAEGAKDDLDLVKEVLNFVNPDIDLTSADASTISRIGVKKDGNDARPRPIKVKLL